MAEEELEQIKAQVENTEPQPTDAERLEKLARENEKLTAIAQRAQADLINFRRRVAQEREEDRLREARRLGLRVLEVLDQLETALASSAEGGAVDWRQGVDAVCKNFQNVLAQEGFERFDALGSPFNPQEHDALLTQPSSKHGEGEIVDQIRPGYRHKGEVVRPAQVVIAAPPEQGGQDAQGAQP